MPKLLQLEAVRRRDAYAKGATHGYTVDIDLATAEALARIHAAHGTIDLRIQDYIAAIVRRYVKDFDPQLQQQPQAPASAGK